jgi:hypothetical protein
VRGESTGDHKRDQGYTYTDGTATMLRIVFIGMLHRFILFKSKVINNYLLHLIHMTLLEEYCPVRPASLERIRVCTRVTSHDKDDKRMYVKFYGPLTITMNGTPSQKVS